MQKVLKSSIDHIKVQKCKKSGKSEKKWKNAKKSYKFTKVQNEANALSICPDKIFFVPDKITFVPDKKICPKLKKCIFACEMDGK